MAGSFKTPCPSCEADVLVKGSNLIGKKIDCPKCKYRFTVPDPKGDADDGFEVVDKAKKKGNPKALVGIALGVIGVAVLVGGGMFLFGGSGDGDKPKDPPSGNAKNDRPKISPQPQPEPEPAPKDTTGKKDDLAPPPIFRPDAGTKKDATPPPKLDEIARAPLNMKDATNLLPGQAEAVMKISFDRMRTTPVHDPFFDKTMREFFQGSMGFEAADLDTAHFCLTDAVRDPFVVIRLRKPVSLLHLQQRYGSTLEVMPMINQRMLFAFKPNSNAFISALSRVVSAESLRNDAGVPITEDEKKRWSEDKRMGFHYYDSQTIMIGDLAVVQRYLGELGRNGEPPHLSEGIAPVAEPAAGAAPEAPSKTGETTTTTTTTTSGQPPAEGDPKLLAAKPNYLTIKPELKAMFNRLEMDEKNLPSLAYVDRVNQRTFAFEDRDFNSNDIVALIFKQFFRHIEVMGLGVKTVNKDKLAATMLFKYLSEVDMKNSIKDEIVPFFTNYQAVLSFYFGSKIDIISQEGSASAGNPGGGTVATAPAGGGRGRGETTSGSGQPEVDLGGFALQSKITISSLDLTAEIDVDINISADAYKARVQPQLLDLITQMKGRMMVLSGETTWYSLSSRFQSLFKDAKGSPVGTLPRNSTPARFGIPYAPDHRASFIVDLLPYLNRGTLRDSIQEKKFAWYSKENLKAAQTWVPELLVPYYPQSSWRAFHPLAEGGRAALGATNFVGLSGIGRDSARFDPNDSIQSKLVGMTGYNWGSKPGEVTDGMSNTIYMIQVPPTHNRPWIAGGGATVMGVDSEGNPIQDFVSVEAGKRGTYALMADGSVRFLPDNIDPKLFRAMVTRAGGEKIEEDVSKLNLVPAPKNSEAELRGGNKSATKKDSKSFGAVDAEELKKLQGKWRVTAMFRNGANVTPSELTEQDITITVKGAVMTIGSAGNPGTEVTIKHLDPKANPKQISFQNAQEAAHERIAAGVYVLTDKKLKMRYIKNSKGDTRPAEVKNPGPGTDDQESYMELEKFE